MSHPVCVPTTSPGDIRDQILSTRAEVIDGVIFLRFDPGYYRDKYYAVFVNGVYVGQNVYAPMLGMVEAAYPIGPGTTVGSIYIEDAGEWSAFDGFVPTPLVEELEASSARRLRMSWSASYSASTVRGDSQLSSITITGAKRGVNVAANPLRKTRGTLTYSIKAVGADRIVRWYAENKMVAEGSRTGNGAVTCSAVNDSGLSVACTLTYTADLAPGTAEIELRWPKEYQIHYSTSALSYPRTPEDTVEDNGGSEFFYQTPVLDAGSYNYNVVSVDDEGDEQASPSAPADSPKTVNGAPAAPTITSVAVNGTTPSIVANESATGSGTSATVGITTSGSDRFLVVFVAHSNGASGSVVTGVTFGAQSMTLLSAESPNSGSACSIWYLDDPAAGFATVTATLSSSRDWFIGAIALSSAVGVANPYMSTTTSATTLTSSIPAVPSAGRLLFMAGASSDYSTFDVTGTGASQLGIRSRADGYRLLIADDDTGSYGVADSATVSTLFLYGVQVAGVGPYSLTPTWTIGESGCTYKLYYSHPGEPVNLGTKATPAPVGPTAADATSATTGTVTGYAPTSLTSARTTLESSLATAVDTANSSYTQAAFPAAFATLLTSCDTAIETYCSAASIRSKAWLEQLGERHALALEYINGLPTLSADRWKDAVAPVYAGWLALLGNMLKRKPDRFIAPNGGVAGGTTGSTTTGVGSNIFGFVSYDIEPVRVSLFEMSTPPILYKPIRLIVRATKGGIEETRDEETVVEIFSNGLDVGTRPNMAYISELSFSNSLTLTAVAYVDTANALTDPTHIDLYVKAYASGAIDPTSDVRVATETIAYAPDGEPYAELEYTVSASGHYRVAALARSGSALSATWTERTVYISNDTPSAVSGLTASVIRGTGIVLP